MNELSTQAATNENQSLPPQPPQIGGWLIVIAVALAFSLMQNLTQLPQVLGALGGPIWIRLTTPASPLYHPYWKIAIIYAAITGCFYVVMNVVMLILFFARRRLFTKLTVALIPTIFILSLAGYYFVGLIPGVAERPAHITNGHLLIGKFVALHIWIPYLLVSKRVKQTFVC
jgi:hypothetical protein